MKDEDDHKDSERESTETKEPEDLSIHVGVRT